MAIAGGANVTKRSGILNKKIVLSIVMALVVMLTFTSCASAATYTDTEHWAKNYIDYATEQCYFYGTSETTFSPDEDMTRGMFVTVLARYANANLDQYELSPFEDILEETYYTKPVLWAHENAIVCGVSDTKFAPDASLTREQAAVILYRYLGLENNVEAPNYNDWSMVSNWAEDGVASMTSANLMVGIDSNFCPQKNITRAEVAVLFSRIDGESFDIYAPPSPPMYLIGTYKITYYCGGCAGSMTASGKYATPDHTVALPRSMWGQWKQYVGRTVYIENIGYRVIEDKCGSSSFDLFCTGGCGSRPFNVTYQKVYLVD